MKTIVLGSINMDLVIQTEVFPKQGETVIGKGFFTSPGGKGANQATAIAKMGIKPTFIGCVGDDLYGNQLLSTMLENGVNIDCVKQVDVPTGVAMIVLYDGDNRIIVNPGANHMVSKDQLFEVISSFDSDTIFLTQFENNLDAIEYSLSLAKEKGMYTILNPAPYVDVNPKIYQNLDLLVLNQSECETLSKIQLNSNESIDIALQKILDLGVKRIVLTLGSKGSIFKTKRILKRIKPVQVKAIDTTCAGDTYIGALISQMSKKEVSIEKSCDFASFASSIAVTREGGQNAIPTIDEVLAKMNSK